MKKRRKQTPKNKDTKDILNDLPDCVLLHILTLSFLNARDAVRTCLLSTRWKHLWKHLPILSLHAYHFRTFEGFTEFVNRILSLRDASTAVNTLDFVSSHRQVKPDLLERIVRYSVSHNVNRLRLSSPDMHDFPFSLFSCSSLTYLDIGFPDYHRVKFPNSMNLPSLTYLRLRFFSFCGNACRVEPFSTYNRLNTLILHHCLVADARTLCISSTTLLNLSIYSGYDSEYYLDIELCTPNLCTFAFTGTPILKPSGSNLFSIEQVNIELYNYPAPSSLITDCPLIILNWLVKLVNIKSLTVSATTLQVLSTISDSLKVTMPPSWYNLKSLKVKGMRPFGSAIMNQGNFNLELAGGGKSWKENVKLRKAIEALFQRYGFIPCEIVVFLLQNAPSAKIDLIDDSRDTTFF